MDVTEREVLEAKGTKEEGWKPSNRRETKRRAGNDNKRKEKAREGLGVN